MCGNYDDGYMEVSVDHKLCPQCHRVKHKDEFYKNRSVKDGLGWTCKPCTHTNQRRSGREWRRRSRGNPWTDLLMAAAIESQGGRCDYCHQLFDESDHALRSCGDHVHGANLCRGVLHYVCNLHLGAIEKRPVLRRGLISADAYLSKWEAFYRQEQTA